MRRFAVVGVLVLLLTPWAAASDPLRAGVATVDITPPVGFPMWGYGARHDMPSQGVMDPLHAKAVVLEAGDQRLALVGLDLGRAPMRDSMARIREQVRDESGVGTVLIVGSHTHHGPVIETTNWPTPEHPYVRDLEARIADAIRGHWKLPNPPVDRELSVIRLDRADGTPLAILVNFAAHPTMTPGEDLRFSADYPGYMMARVQDELGGTCVFLQGAAGDLSANADGRSVAEFGKALGDAVIEVARLATPVMLDDASIQSREDDFHFESRVDFSPPLVLELFAQAFYRDLAVAGIAEFAPGIRPHLTTALLSDGRRPLLALVGASGEFFCDHAIQLKRRLPVRTMVFGYCNDYQWYFPTIESAAQGGYGGDSTVAPAEVGAGEQVINRALMRVFEMIGKW